MNKLLGFLSVTALLVPLLASADVVSCPNLYRNLSSGSRGSDVVELQNFLIAQGDLQAGSNTGYFGRLTEGAVKSWQARNGVVSSGTALTTGYGAVGPRTRAKIANMCGGGGNVSANFAATPTSGIAPLAVMFSATLKSGTYSIDYGDGSSSGPLQQWACQNISGFCPFVVNHSYASSGTYTAKLYSSDTDGRGYCGPGPYCGSLPIGIVTIMVRGTSVPPTTISCGPRDAFVPVCGHVPGFCPSGGNGIQLGMPCSAPRDGTFLNMCELQDAQATLLYSGTCTGQALQPLLVLSPHGGETFAPGNPITISWQSPRPDSATTHINLSLGSVPQNTGSTCTTTTNGNTSTTCSATAGSIQLIPGIITGTSYTWTIPQSYTNAPGQYRISVGWNDTDISMSAYSGAFTISGH